MCVVTMMISNFACIGGGVVHTRVVVGACVVKVQLGGVHGTVVVAPAIIIVIIVTDSDSDSTCQPKHPQYVPGH